MKLLDQLEATHFVSPGILDLMKSELVTNRVLVDYFHSLGIKTNPTAVHLARRALGRSVSPRTSCIDRQLAERGKLDQVNALAIDRSVGNETVRMAIKSVIGYAPHKATVTKWRRNKGFPVLSHGGLNSIRNVMKRKGAKPETVKAVYDKSVDPKDAAEIVYQDIGVRFLAKTIRTERERK